MKHAIRLLICLAIALLAASTTASAQELDDAMVRFTSAWRRNDYKTISTLIARDGASIETDAGRLGPLGARQVAAVLRVIFNERSTTQVRTRQFQGVGGSPQKGYAELIWMTMAPETTEPLRIVVFVEFILEQDRDWRVTRIRLMQP